MSSPEVKVVVRYRVQPGKLEQAKREIRALIAQVLPEEGCRGITILQGVSDPNELLLDELWSDAETYLGPHSETPYLGACWRVLGGTTGDNPLAGDRLSAPGAPTPPAPA